MFIYLYFRPCLHLPYTHSMSVTIPSKNEICSLLFFNLYLSAFDVCYKFRNFGIMAAGVISLLNRCTRPSSWCASFRKEQKGFARLSTFSFFSGHDEWKYSHSEWYLCVDCNCVCLLFLEGCLV